MLTSIDNRLIDNNDKYNQFLAIFKLNDVDGDVDTNGSMDDDVVVGCVWLLILHWIRWNSHLVPQSGGREQRKK